MKTAAMPLDYEEVVISRKLYRNGEERIFDHKSKVRLQDVFILVAKAILARRVQYCVARLN
jgi:chromosome segregation ATPase